MKKCILTLSLFLLCVSTIHAQSIEEMQQELRDLQEENAISIFELLTTPKRMGSLRNTAFIIARDDNNEARAILVALSNAHIMLALMFEQLANIHGWDNVSLDALSNDAISSADVDRASELVWKCVNSNYLDCAPN